MTPDFTTTGIPAEWQMLLYRIQRKEPRAIIAGGALRDHYLGRPVSDLDIFVPVGGGDAAGVVELDRPKLVHQVPEPYMIFDSEVRQIGLWASDILDITPVNLIHVSDYVCTPWDQINRFDFGVCQIAYDGRQLHMTSAFCRDVSQKTFTYTRTSPTEAQHEQSMKRYARLQAKYAGWAMVDPRKPVDLFGDL